MANNEIETPDDLGPEIPVDLKFQPYAHIRQDFRSGATRHIAPSGFTGRDFTVRGLVAVKLTPIIRTFIKMGDEWFSDIHQVFSGNVLQFWNLPIDSDNDPALY